MNDKKILLIFCHLLTMIQLINCFTDYDEIENSEDDESSIFGHDYDKPVSSGEPCEALKNHTWFEFGQQVTCVKKQSSISSPNLTLLLSKELDVKGLDFYQNKNIHYLPINLYQNAPNLLTIDAGHSGIKALYKTNFEKLYKLKHLWMYYNDIETIPDGVFDDLVSLEKISLEKNKIFSVEGNIFPALTLLTHVDFRFNPCINEEFTNSAFKSLTMSKVIFDYCGVCKATNCVIESKITESTEIITGKIQTFVEAFEAKTLLNLANHKLDQAKDQIIGLEKSKSELQETKQSLKSEVEEFHSKFIKMTMENEILKKDIKKQKFESEKLEMKNGKLLSENQQLKADLTISQEKLETSKTLEDLQDFIQKLSAH